MKERIVSKYDGHVVYNLVYQFCIVAPVMAGVQMVCHYRGIDAESISRVNLAAGIVILISSLSAVYGTKVLAHIVEESPPIRYQLHERPWFIPAPDLSKVAPKKNIKIKINWLVLVTVLPNMSSLIVRLSVSGDTCQENGKVLLEEDVRSYIAALVSILWNFIAVIFAYLKAFPLHSDPHDISEVVEVIVGKVLEMEVMPARALELFRSGIHGILKDRDQRGIDRNFGLKKTEDWDVLFSAGKNEVQVGDFAA